MKIVQKYVANDGSEWDNEKQCLFREKLLQEVAEIMSELEPHPDQANWEGYVQQNKIIIRDIRIQLLKLAYDSSTSMHCWVDAQIVDSNMPLDIFAVSKPLDFFLRAFDGETFKPIQNGYYRLYCIDNNYREWNQPYYALHPDKGVHRRVN